MASVRIRAVPCLEVTDCIVYLKPVLNSSSGSPEHIKRCGIRAMTSTTLLSGVVLSCTTSRSFRTIDLKEDESAHFSCTGVVLPSSSKRFNTSEVNPSVSSFADTVVSSADFCVKSSWMTLDLTFSKRSINTDLCIFSSSFSWSWTLLVTL